MNGCTRNGHTVGGPVGERQFGATPGVVVLDPLAELLSAWDGEASSAAEIAAFVRLSGVVPTA